MNQKHYLVRIPICCAGCWTAGTKWIINHSLSAADHINQQSLHTGRGSLVFWCCGTVFIYPRRLTHAGVWFVICIPDSGDFRCQSESEGSGSFWGGPDMCAAVRGGMDSQRLMYCCMLGECLPGAFIRKGKKTFPLHPTPHATVWLSQITCWCTAYVCDLIDSSWKIFFI